MSGHDEDDAWRSIVENYGDRPDVEDLPDPEPDVEPGPEPFRASETFEDEDTFRPPPPPPLPHPPPVRLAAWCGLFGAPAILLVAAVTGLPLPSWLAYALVASFLGGFAYLVIHMQRGPRDPGDDGARL